MKKNIGIRNFSEQDLKRNLGLILGPILFLTMLLIPFPSGAIFENSSSQSETEGLFTVILPQIALGTMLWMIIWWVTECVPLGFTSLLAPFIFVITGILTVDEALPKFADPIIWIFISGFVLAAAFKKCGLDKRIAFKLALFYKGNNPKMAIFFVACLPVFLLSMTGSITASTTIVFPFVLAYLRTLKTSFFESNRLSNNNIDRHINSRSLDVDSNKISNNDTEINKYTEASFLSLGQAATAGAMLLLISTAPNLIAKATVEDFVPGMTVSFTDWLVIGLPLAVIGLLVSWNIVFLLLCPKINFPSKIRDQFKNSLGKAGKIKTEEKAVLTILFLAMSLWIIPSVLRSFYPDDGNDDLIGAVNTMSHLSNQMINILSNIPESVPALLIILLIGLVKIKVYRTNDTGEVVEKIGADEGKRAPNSWQPILSWNDILESIDWNIVFLFGGGLVLGLGIEASGLATLLGNLISENAGPLSTEWGIFTISAVMAFLMSYAASNTASAVIVCPIAASLAIGAGFSPIPSIIAAGLGASISSALPSTTPPMAIVYSSKAVTILNMFKTGMVSDLLRLMVLIILGPFLISIIYG